MFKLESGVLLRIARRMHVSSQSWSSSVHRRHLVGEKPWRSSKSIASFCLAFDGVHSSVVFVV